MKKFIKRLTLILIVLLVLIIAVFTWAIKSESGLHWVQDRVSSWVTFDSLSGKLSDEISFTGFKLTLPTTEVTINRGSISWTPAKLISMELEVNTISFGAIDVLSKAVEPTQNTPFQGLTLPINISIKNVSVDNLTIASEDKELVKLSDIKLSASMSDNHLSLNALSASHELGKLTLNGDSNLGSPILSPTSITTEWQLLRNEKTITGAGKITGNLNNLSFIQNVNAPFSASINSTFTDLAKGKPSWNVNTQFDELPASLLSAQLTGVVSAGTIITAGSLAQWNSQLLITSTDKNGQQWSLDAAISSLNQALNIEKISFAETLINSTKPSTKLASVVLVGQIDAIDKLSAPVNNLTDSDLPINLSVKWQNLRWPLDSGDSIIKNTNGDALINGELNNYTLSVNSDITHTQAGLNRITIKGSGNTQSAILDSISSLGELGSLLGKAQVSWQPSLTWSANVDIADLDPGYLAPEWPGKLSGRINSDGNNDTGALIANIDIAKVQGELRGKPLTALATANINADTINLKNVKIASGNSRLEVTGHIGQSLDLNWNLNSPDLNDLMPDAKGQLDSNGFIKGTLQQPDVRVSLLGRNLEFGDWSIASLDSESTINLTTTNSDWDANWTIQGLKQADTAWFDDALLTLTGKADNHTLTFNSNGEVIQQATLSGQLKNSIWSGVLSNFSLANKVIGDWSLISPTALMFGGSKNSLEPFCLKSRSQEICGAFSANQQASTGSLKFSQIDNTNFNRFLNAYQVKALGTVSGDIDFKLDSGASAPQVSGNLISQNSRLNYRVTDPETDDLVDRDLPLALISLSFTHDTSAVAKWDLRFADSDTITGELKSDKSVDFKEWQTAPVYGKTNINIQDLAFLTPFVAPDIDIVNGSLNIDGSIDGKLGQPSLGLRANLNSAKIEVRPTGTTLSNINLNLNSQPDNKLSIDGTMLVGKGELAAKGLIDYEILQKPTLDLTMVGSKLALLNAPDMSAVGGFDLKLSLRPQLVDLTGSINIEEANIRAGQPAGVIKASPDVVLEGLEIAQSRFKQTFNLKIDLGENTRIDASGFEGFLDGNTRIVQKDNGFAVGEGDITVRDGKFSAFGQSLDITKGEIIYAGGALDNPQLNLQALKTIDSVKAGVNVTGRAQNPKVTLYSEPGMSDQDVLSHLVFDKPIDKLAATDAIALVKIANSFRGESNGRLSQISKTVTDTLGLSEFEINTVGENPNLKVGKKLFSEFYIGYGYSLLDAAQTLFLRYNISKDWSVQSDLGVESGADIRYQIETN